MPLADAIAPTTVDRAADSPAIDWLHAMLARNARTDYLSAFGAPQTVDHFRSRVPVCTYEDLVTHLERIQGGAANVLFAGRPVAYERTGGSRSGPKLIPYSREGLLDFQRSVEPWFLETLSRHRVSGRVYFSISPATRKPEAIGDIPVGLSDGAYLGERAGRALATLSAVPPSVGALTDVDAWRRATLEHLAAARDLELISVWSPTFLLRLLDELPDPTRLWPRLKLVSCWASGPAERSATELRRRLPHAEIQPKGLLSTEVVVTVPDATMRPALVEHGFFEFADGDRLCLEGELEPGRSYEVIATTANGLYRYRTGDQVRHEGTNARGRPLLDFVGRGSTACDITGEKLTDAFVSRCLAEVAGAPVLVPCFKPAGYVLVCEQAAAASAGAVEERLAANPQYAYSRKLGQLAALRALVQPRAQEIVERHLLSQGVRLGDIKPLALRGEPFWLELFTEEFR